jgi:enolase
MDSKIYSVTAREILDSRGNPTVEATVILNSGYRGVASVPAGASIGSYEAVELRDKDTNRYNGLGVLQAVNNVNNFIAPSLKGHDALNQGEIDKLMIDLDGTPNKQRLGANSILGVSLANAVAASNFTRQPLYRYLNAMFSATIPTKMEKIPTPTLNLINGGLHGAGNLDFQEFHVVPATNKPFHEALQMGVEVYQSVKKILKYRNAVVSVGDEGGFAPNLYTNLDALEVLSEGIRNSKYRLGVDIFLGLDLASSNFKVDRGYQIKDRPLAFDKEEFINYLCDLNKKYQMLLMEDALDQDDWSGWHTLLERIGNSVMLVGDDLLATNPARLEKAIAEKACSGILCKPNQIGSLSEFLSVIVLAKKNNIGCIVSHRSGETNDTFISDLAVAVQSEYVKFGAPARGERIAKYNRLLQIESELFPH